MPGLFIMSGEPSSANYIEGFVNSLRQKGYSGAINSISSSRLKNLDVNVIYDPNSFATVGVFEALGNLFKYAKLFRIASSAIRDLKPGCVIFMDLPDFNIRLAGYVKSLGIPCLYYIPPQVWAWRKSRISELKEYFDELLVVFKFEEEFFNNHSVRCRYVGHPLVELIRKNNPSDIRDSLGLSRSDVVISLFPASRRQQFSSFAPLLARASTRINKTVQASGKQCRFVMCIADEVAQLAQNYKKNPGFEHIIFQKNDQYSLMKTSDLVITKCGTTTFEAMLMGTPMVTFYRLNPFAYAILKPLIKFHVDYFSLPNILGGRHVVPELIQRDASVENIARVASELIISGGLDKMRGHLNYLRNSIDDMNTSDIIADIVLKYLC